MQQEKCKACSSQMPPQGMVGYGGQPVRKLITVILSPIRPPVTRCLESAIRRVKYAVARRSTKVVGLEGMPPPAPRAARSEIEFTPEDDQLLVT